MNALEQPRQYKMNRRLAWWKQGGWDEQGM